LRQIVETYDARNQIETDIAHLKEKLLIPLKPVYVRKDLKIRSHVFLCVIGLLLYNHLLYVNGVNAGIKLSNYSGINLSIST